MRTGEGILKEVRQAQNIHFSLLSKISFKKPKKTKKNETNNAFISKFTFNSWSAASSTIYLIKFNLNCLFVKDMDSRAIDCLGGYYLLMENKTQIHRGTDVQ